MKMIMSSIVGMIRLLFIVFAIATPCFILVIPLWILGVKKPWLKMTNFFDELINVD